MIEKNSAKKKKHDFIVGRFVMLKKLEQNKSVWFKPIVFFFILSLKYL